MSTSTEFAVTIIIKEEKPQSLYNLHYDLFNILMDHRGASVLRDAVLEELREIHPGLSDIKMRKAKQTLIENGYPIGSSTDGWYVITRGDSIGADIAAKQYENRAKKEWYLGSKIRKNAIDFWKQKTLF